MPYLSTRHREEFREIKFEGPYMRLKANWLDSTYFAEDADGQKYARPGIVLAEDTDTNKFVPYSAGASYGTGSDTAVGMLDTLEILSLGDEAVAPVYHGALIEAHCNVYGAAYGNIPGGVKTALADIKWV